MKVSNNGLHLLNQLKYFRLSEDKDYNGFDQQHLFDRRNVSNNLLQIVNQSKYLRYSENWDYNRTRRSHLLNHHVL
jgi:hypothetical protein